MLVDCSGLLSSCPWVPRLLLPLGNSDGVETNTAAGVPITGYCPATGSCAIGRGAELLLFSLQAAGAPNETLKSEKKSEVTLLEFDNPLTAMCWDQKGTLLVVADSHKTLHFIDGTPQKHSLLFSHPLPLPVGNCGSI